MRSHLILAALLLAACNSSSSSSTPPVTPAPVSSSTTATDPSAVDAAVAPAPSSTIADPGRTAIEAARPTANAINATNAALYAQLAKTPGNLIYSPASIETALAMTAAGAKGTTLAEMQKTLHLPADPTKAANDFSALLASWAQTAPDAPTLAVANHIWVQHGYPLVPSYVTVTRDKYFAPATTLDFVDSAAAAQTINEWVAKSTQDKITNLISPAMLGTSTRLVLTNAVYFRGDWQTPFKKSLTKDGPFTTDANAKVTVPLMTNGLSVPYADLGNAQIVDLPYRSTPTRELALTIVLPKAGTSLSALEQAFDAGSLDRWTKKQPWTEIVVTIPRFKAEFSTSLSMQLAAMGMPTAFSDKADFSGISTKGPLHISDVAHKAMIEVDETGTVAAAATAVMVAGGGPPSASPPVFRADHPFLFFLRDKTTGAVLFAGRVVDPSKS